MSATPNLTPEHELGAHLCRVLREGDPRRQGRSIAEAAHLIVARARALGLCGEPPACEAAEPLELARLREAFRRAAERGCGIDVMLAPILSTAHLTENEACAPEDNWPALALESRNYGWVVYIADIDYQDRDLRASWPGLCASIEWAAGLGFEWIRFDRDGNKERTVRTYDW